MGDLMNENNDFQQSDSLTPHPQYHYHYHYYPSEWDLGRRGKPKHGRARRRRTVKGKLRQNANIVCAGLLLLMVFSIVSYLLPHFLARLLIGANRLAELRHVIGQAVALFSFFISYGVALLLIKAWLKIPARAAFPMRMKGFSITFPAIFICLGINLLGVFFYVVIAQVLELAFGIVSSSPDFSPPEGAAAITMHIIALVVLPSVLEELVFRGVVMQSLRRFGDSFALVISSILFGLVHGNLVQFIPSFLTGLAIGFFVLRSGSILTGILIHAVNNGILVTISLLTRGGSEQLIIIANNAMSILCLCSGVIAVVMLMWRRPGIFSTAPARISLKSWKKYLYFFTSAAPIAFVIATVGLITMNLIG